MADKICGDGIGNSTGRSYNDEVDLITSTTMYGSSPGEPRTLLQSVDAADTKKKPTSFQITSVTVQSTRLSDDGGDESADDLDESRTEDLSSDALVCAKTTDTEQLSPTEDNGSSAAPAPPAPAEAVVEPVTAASAPSNPVPSAGQATMTMSPAVVAGAAGTLAIAGGATAGPSATGSSINPDHWQRRFKVVKIVRSEPFSRGRWLCMDFIDPPATQGDAKAGEGRESGTAATHLPPAVSNEAMSHVYETPVGQTYPTNSQDKGPPYGINLPVSAGGQGASPLGVLQPVTGQATAAEQPTPVTPPPQAAAVAPAPVAEQPLPPVAAAAAGAAAQATEPLPENTKKPATEEVPESTSAGSKVAIDNKIEQAMDLVKSHLMFAVREEVDELKEKITELLDRIAKLEHENGILRAGASPETLSLLAQPAQPVPAAPQQPQPQQTLPAVAAAAAAAQPVVGPPWPQVPVAAMQHVAVQQAALVQPQAPPQLAAVVQQPQQLQHPQQHSQPLPLQPHQEQQQQQKRQPFPQPPT